MRRADAECGGSSFLSLVEAQKHEIWKFTEHIQGRARKKTLCVQNFISTLGYLPTFYQRKGFNKTVWTNPNIRMVISLKKGQLNMKILNKVRQLEQLTFIEPSL
jgi:hypothetical protein